LTIELNRVDLAIDGRRPHLGRRKLIMPHGTARQVIAARRKGSRQTSHETFTLSDANHAVRPAKTPVDRIPIDSIITAHSSDE
jgi:hypothetical protein